MRTLSVDLGTSNTVAVLAAHGRPPRVIEVDGSATMPSAVYAAEDGGLVVGRDAERRARLDPARFEPNPKRRVDDGTLLLGDTVVPVADALAAILRRVTDEARRQLGGPPEEIRLTHPAQWGPARRSVLLAAARQAGLNAVNLVPEPVAAAAHFAALGRTLAAGRPLAVYDLGAGTFDVAVVAVTPHGFAVLAEDGLSDFGGLDVDQALLDHVGRQVSMRDPAGWQRMLRPTTTADRRAQRTLREDIRVAKEALSRHQQTDLPLPPPFEDVLVTRAELEALIRPSLLRSMDVLKATVHAAGVSVDRLAGVYLVGGSSRVPLVATLIAEQTGLVPVSLDQPETAVALGALHVPRDAAGPRTPARPDVTQAINPDMTQTIGPGETQTIRHVDQTPPRTPIPAPMPPPAYAPQPRRGRGIVAGLATAAVLLLVLVVVLVARPASLPTAESCRTEGDKDSQGFTECLRQLAGALPDDHRCVPAPNGPADVTCTLPEGYQVDYAHVGTVEEARQVLVERLSVMTEDDHVLADWSGNGLDGAYRAGVGEDSGVLVFTVTDRPIVGWVTKSGAGSPNTLADHFERVVQPGE